ncbi:MULTISPECIES: FtsK/SpoIIIE domain-containing protein [unclassified Streptococcus]|uniref:FtsK/SpoIIIE domain-containing protein n=1 Tax=Streptococcus TaxID=1301 RepID=UPI0015635B61|nr:MULTISPECIES: FtsK/SpoIIIE domain-containing protein [unclassified Streptococcus]
MRMLNQRISVMNKYPYFIRPRNIKIVRLAIQIFTLLLLMCSWIATIPFIARLVFSMFFISLLFFVEKFFRSNFIAKLRNKLNIREALFYMLVSLALYDESDNEVVDTAVLYFDVSKDNKVIVCVPLFGNRYLKTLKNLEEYLCPTLGLSLLSKKEEIDKIVYVLGKIEEIEQYVFNTNTLTREFFKDIPSPIIKLSNTQQFSLKSNTNIGIYGRTGTGKTIALQWYLFNALAKGCGTVDGTYLGIVDGKGADLYALGKLLEEELGKSVSVGSSPTSLAKLSRQFVEMMNERFEVIKQNSSLNADAYDLGMTPNFLFIDELASIRDSCGSSKQGKELWNEILQNLGLIARKGRQAGFHLCLSTQDPNADNIPVELRLQISSVLYLSNIGIDRLKMAFSMCELENVPTVSDRKGEALFFADGINSVEPVLTIVPFVDLKTKQEFLQVVRNILPNY